MTTPELIQAELGRAQPRRARATKPCGCEMIATASEEAGGVLFRWCADHDPRRAEDMIADDLDHQSTLLPAAGSKLIRAERRVATSCVVRGGEPPPCNGAMNVIDDAAGDPAWALLAGGGA